MTGIGLGARFLCGIALLSVFLRYKLRRRHLSVNDTIEDFLQGQNNLMPIRYSYSQIKNFPSRIYDQMSKGKEVEMEDVSENESNLVKKMIIVAMRCIQMKPSERPSMNKVIEMLEGDCELVVMPPKSFMSPQEEPDQELPCMS